MTTVEIVQMVHDTLENAKAIDMTGEIEFRFIFNTGGVRDCYTVVKKKIQKN